MKKFSLGSRKSQLLTCTAFTAFVVGGLASPLSVQQALADCSLVNAGNGYICTGTNAANIPTFTPNADGFGVAVGVTSPVPASAAITIINGSPDAALVVNAAANDGTITVLQGSSITAADGGGSRNGLQVSATNATVTTVINGSVVSNDTSLTGGDSLKLNGTNQSTFIVNIGSSGVVGGGAGREAIEVNNAASVQITNAGSVAAGSAGSSNSIKIGDAISGGISGTVSITNSGTITGPGGALSPVIYSRAAGGTTITNNAGGRIGDAAGGDGDLVIASTGSGGIVTINNYGTINGRMAFSAPIVGGGAGVRLNNFSNTTWNTEGITNFTDNVDIVNNEGGTLNTTGVGASINFQNGADILRNHANAQGVGGTINFGGTLGTNLNFGSGDDIFENIEGSTITANTTVIYTFDTGADTFRNNASTYTGTVNTTFFMGDNDDAFYNENRATFTVDGTLNLFDFGSGDDDFVNDNATFTGTGATTTFTFGDGADDFYNQNGGVISLDSTLANNFVFGAGNSTDRFVNTNGSSITLAGPLSNWSFGAGADVFSNQINSTFTSSSLANTILFGEGADVFYNTTGSTFSLTNANGVNTFDFGADVSTDQFWNQNGATFNTTGIATTMLFGQGDDDFVNTGSSTYSSSAIANTFAMGDGNDDFFNDTGSTISLTSDTGVHSFLFGLGNDNFSNQYGSTFTSAGVSTLIDFGDGTDAFINYDGSSFTSTSAVNTFNFGVGVDSFTNSFGSTFVLEPTAALSANTLDFGADVDSLFNGYGSTFRVSGLLNTIVNLEGLTNIYNSQFEMNGVNIIGASEAAGLASLVNDEYSYLELEGISVVNFDANGNTFSNTDGSTFASLGATVVDFNGGDDTFDNYGGRVYSSGTPLAGPLSDVGLLTFLDLETFVGGNGITDMQDGDVFDGIAMINTDYYVDSNDANHYIDGNLSGYNFLVGGDYMAVGSVTGTGTTWVHLNDINIGDGEYNPIGFDIVGVQDGNADIEDFRLAGGPIQKGFFSYDIYMDDGNSFGVLHPKCALTGAGSDCFVIASVEGQRSFELPVLAYGVQNMWHTSTGTWSDRTADLRSAFGGTGFGGGGADAIVEPMEPMAAVGNVTPGVWGRVFGSTQSRDFSNSSAPPLGLEGFDSQFNNNFDQRIYGVMAGVDFGKESLSDQGNQAWIFGLFGGYTGSNLDFGESDTDVDYSAGSIGTYVSYLNGGLFVDATIKADFGKMDYNSGGDSGSADFTSVGGAVDAGYRFTSASGWYFEPKATLAYVHTEYDNLEVFGNDVEFDNGESLRGRIGGRVGTSMDRNGILIEPYLEASAWNEFDGDYSASFFSNGTGFTPSFDAGGVYGEVALGSSFINVANGWSGFAKGSVQFGEDSALGLTGNLGVRKAW